MFLWLFSIYQSTRLHRKLCDSKKSHSKINTFCFLGHYKIEPTNIDLWSGSMLIFVADSLHYLASKRVYHCQLYIPSINRISLCKGCRGATSRNLYVAPGTLFRLTVTWDKRQVHLLQPGRCLEIEFSCTGTTLAVLMSAATPLTK